MLWKVSFISVGQTGSCQRRWLCSWSSHFSWPYFHNNQRYSVLHNVSAFLNFTTALSSLVLNSTWTYVTMYMPLYCNLLKVGPPSKICPPPYLNEIVAKGVFLSKVHPPICPVVHAVKQEVPRKQYIARGGTNKWRQAPFAVIPKASAWQKRS